MQKKTERVGVCLPVSIRWSGNALLVKDVWAETSLKTPLPLAYQVLCDHLAWLWPLPTALCFTTLLQAHWPSCCSSNLPSSFLPQNLFAFRSFCQETSSSRSPRGSRPHFIQVSAPVCTPQESTPQPPAFIVHHSTPSPCLSFLLVYITTWHYICLFCLSDTQTPWRQGLCLIYHCVPTFTTVVLNTCFLSPRFDSNDCTFSC